MGNRKKAQYIHGVHRAEQDRLERLNALINPAFIEFIEIQKGDSVLEVGSGLGIVVSELARRYPDSSFQGMDTSPEQLARARFAHPNLKFIKGDAHELPFDDSSFDVVYCRFVLEHVHDPANVLRGMKRILKKGGRVFIQENDVAVITFDPDLPVYLNLWRKFIQLQSALGGDALIGRKLYGLMKEIGFQDIELSIDPEVHWYGEEGFKTWIDNIIVIVDGARGELIGQGIAAEDEIAGAMRELDAFKSNPGASTYFYWNRVRAHT